MKARQLEKLRNSIHSLVHSFAGELGRVERQDGCAHYIIGLLLEGERKSIQPMADRVVLFLLKIPLSRSPLFSLTPVLDNAGYNRAKKVKKVAKGLNITFAHLPPWSPNLNLIDRLWKLMKKKVLANTYYETFPDFKKSILYTCVVSILNKRCFFTPSGRFG